jgi:transposase-like protein
MQRIGDSKDPGSTPESRAATPGAPERSGGERSEPQRSGGAPGTARAGAGLAAVSPPNPEVSEKPVRRQFKAEYKLRILREADACKDKPGEIGKLLRREGLYSSILSTWRRQREEGTLKGLTPKKRGRKGKRNDPTTRKVAQLEKENRRLKKKLEQAELIIDIQKKVAALLGIPLKSPESGESG